MSSGELSFESPPFLRVTWEIPDFFQQTKEGIEFSLQSPDLTFVDGCYRLRFLPTVDAGCYPVGIELLNLTDTDPGRAVLYEVELRSGAGEYSLIRPDKNSKIFGISQSILRSIRNQATLTVLCSVRLRKPSSAESPKSSGAQTQVVPNCNMTGNLSFQTPPFLYVTWRIPGIFQLSRESEYTLESPEFPFYGRCYCLQLFSNTNRLVIKLRNLTDTVPGRYVSYEVGLKSTSGKEVEIDYYDTSTAREFCILQSELDNERYSCFSDGHLTVFCSMRSKELNSAASPKSGGGETANKEEDMQGLSGPSKLLSDLGQLLLKGAESDVCLVVRGKEFRAHKNILRARSPVFDAMFDHEAAEKACGRVVIDDLDPNSFGDFLEYLYTGSVGAGLSDRNVFWLYEAADRFDVTTLKSECAAHMRTRNSAHGCM